MAALAAMGSLAAYAGDDTPTFKFTPGGRVLFDAAAYGPAKDGFSDGVSLPDIRIGGKATYGQWAAKLDIGFGYGKLSMKDVYIQYNFKGTNNLIRGGYFVHQYGLNAATSSSFKPGGEAATSDDFFAATSRNLGINYILDTKPFFMGISGITGTGLSGDNTATKGFTSVGALGRFVYRPITDDGKVVQIGVSPWIQKSFRNKTNPDVRYFDYSANFPTRVAKVGMLSANIDHAKSVFKLTPEWVLAYNRVAFEGQYYYMDVMRNDGYKNYQAQGVYGNLRCLILGDNQYGYSHADAGLALPKPKTLELVAGYNYTDANSVGIDGGITNDYSVTFNYYINKYMLARLGWHYTDVRSSDATFNRHVNIIQARLQFKF